MSRNREASIRYQEWAWNGCHVGNTSLVEPEAESGEVQVWEALFRAGFESRDREVALLIDVIERFIESRPVPLAPSPMETFHYAQGLFNGYCMYKEAIKTGGGSPATPDHENKKKENADEPT